MTLTSLVTTLALLVPAPQVQAGPGAPIDGLRLIEYRDDHGVRDSLIATGAFFGDLGRWGIARMSDADAAALAARGVPIAKIPPIRDGEVLVAAARTRAGAGPMHGRLLLARRRLFLTAARPAELPDDCGGSGFHGGVQVLRLDRPYVPSTDAAPLAPNGPASPAAADPRITAMVGRVVQSNLLGHVTRLSAIYSRRATRAENAQAVSYVTGELRKISGVTFRTERFSSRYGPNIIAELPGTDLPNEIVMVGAHLDSIVSRNSSARAPGADDNASGSAAVLEIARIFATQKLRRTIRFGWWNAEELGLIGSGAYASAARSRGDQIIAYVNTDMNAYRAPGDSLSVDYVTNDSTTSLINRLVASTRTYVPSLPTKVGPLFGGTSDHRSFFRNGFPAAFPFEDIGSYSRLIHTSSDTIGTSANDFNLSRLITQSLVAGLADLAGLPTGRPGRFTTFGRGCLGSAGVPLLSNLGLPVINTSFDVSLAFARSNTSAVLVTGVSNTRWAGGRLPVQLPGAPGCLLLTSADIGSQTTTGPFGAVNMTIPVPNNAALVGASVYHQWIVVDRSANTIGLVVSNGGQSTIGG